MYNNSVVYNKRALRPDTATNLLSTSAGHYLHSLVSDTPVSAKATRRLRELCCFPRFLETALFLLQKLPNTEKIQEVDGY